MAGKGCHFGWKAFDRDVFMIAKEAWVEEVRSKLEKNSQRQGWAKRVENEVLYKDSKQDDIK